MSNKSLRKEFGIAIAAGQTTVLIRTDEQPDALATINAVCDKNYWDLRVWDAINGVKAGRQNPTTTTSRSSTPANLQGAPTLLQDLTTFLRAEPKKDHDGNPVPIVFVIRNLNLSLMSGQTHQQIAVLQLLADEGKDDLKFIVAMVTPEARLPPELAPLFYIINHELPDEEELGEVLDGIMDDADSGPPIKTNKEDRHKAIKAALGLNRLQAESAFSMCMQEHRQIVPEAIWARKAAILNEEGLVTIYAGKERFDVVGGLTGAKEFFLHLLDYDEYDRDNPAVRAKGVTLLGAPGVGKTLIAKCLGNETGRPTLLINVGKLMGSLVGQTEANTRRMFQIVRRMSPCIAIIDEFGKQMPSTSSKNLDSGVGARLAGEFLSALNDIQEDVFWAFCENDISHIDRGFTRAERIDAIFYVKLPGPAQRAIVWKIYFDKFFPREINGKLYPHYVELSVSTLLDMYRKDRGKPEEWCDKFTPALMCLARKEREEAIDACREMDHDLGELVASRLIDDSEWTPAEICSAVRLMRRLKKPLGKIQNMIGHVAKGDIDRIQRIEEWCMSNGALDAETGELLQLSVLAKSKTTEEGKEPRKARRRVRHLSE